MCRYGTYCTLAHGKNELKYWMEYNKDFQEAKNEEELSCQKPERSADITRSEVQVPYQVSSRHSVRGRPSVHVHNTNLA